MKTKQPLTRTASEHVEELLDEALAQTFPASDPIAVSPPPSAHSGVTYAALRPPSTRNSVPVM
jgi:hypothetical protein